VTRHNASTLAGGDNASSGSGTETPIILGTTGGVSVFLVEVDDTEYGVTRPHIVGPFASVREAEVFADRHGMGWAAQNGQGGYSAVHVVAAEFAQLPEQYVGAIDLDPTKGIGMTEQRTGPDFTVAGTALIEWLGHDPHEATIKAAEQAIAIPGEAFIAAVFDQSDKSAAKWADGQRRALRVWSGKHHPDLPGRVRLNLRSKTTPAGDAVKVAAVTFDKAKAVKS
jgi:hypothetical protein